MRQRSSRSTDLYASERLSDHHSTEAFHSGNDSLDKWLTVSARQSDRRNNTRTYVWSEEDDLVIAYFTLCPHIIQKIELRPNDARGNLNEIPAILLARLALGVDLHGSGLAGQLLVDALSRAVFGQEIVGGRYIVADAINSDAVSFYAHHGFVASPDNEYRMYLAVKDAVASLA